jgi:trk system potassium uptake protein
MLLSKFLKDWISPQKNFLTFRNIFDKTLFVSAIVLLIMAIRDFNFPQQLNSESYLHNNLYFKVLFAFVGLLYFSKSVFIKGHVSHRKVFFTQFIFGIFLAVIFIPNILFGYGSTIEEFIFRSHIFQILAILIFFFELSRFDIGGLFKVLNPAQLFMLSFTIIIFTGAVLLMMPMATTAPLRFIDALFTSTSAVCVTGLVVVDTATRFTFLGKFIILFLIQIGGIGVMTLTSFFGIFFKEKTSFREQSMLRDYLSEDSFDAILKTLMKVVLVTLLIETLGAVCIYLSLETNTIGSTFTQMKFSVFHAVSAFCNAGFSTLTDNLYDARIRTNYGIQFWIANLIVIGGIGYPILLNLYQYCKKQVIWIWRYIKTREHYSHRVNLISLNSKIVMFSTFILIIFGTIAFFYFEADHTQSGLGMKARLVMSYFQSVTPRTAGFNNCSMTALATPSILITIFLMWIGASPVSTGGGIKTTTFAIAILNTVRIMKGKNHIEVKRYEIHEYSVNKAFAIITVSILIIICGAFGIYIFDGKFGMQKILFECFSAFGTVGLSLDLTPLLSVPSKTILVLLMFFGRMGCITLLLSMAKTYSTQMLYRYPKENIIIT